MQRDRAFAATRLLEMIPAKTKNTSPAFQALTHPFRVDLRVGLRVVSFRLGQVSSHRPLGRRHLQRPCLPVRDCPILIRPAHRPVAVLEVMAVQRLRKTS